MVPMYKADQMVRTDMYTTFTIDRDIDNVPLLELADRIYDQAKAVDPLCKKQHVAVDISSDYDYGSGRSTVFEVKITRPETDKEWKARVAMLEAAKIAERDRKKAQKKEREEAAYRDYLRLKAKFEKKQPK